MKTCRSFLSVMAVLATTSFTEVIASEPIIYFYNDTFYLEDYEGVFYQYYWAWNLYGSSKTFELSVRIEVIDDDTNEVLACLWANLIPEDGPLAGVWLVIDGDGFENTFDSGSMGCSSGYSECFLWVDYERPQGVEQDLRIEVVAYTSGEDPLDGEVGAFVY